MYFLCEVLTSITYVNRKNYYYKRNYYDKRKICYVTEKKYSLGMNKWREIIII